MNIARTWLAFALALAAGLAFPAAALRAQESEAMIAAAGQLKQRLDAASSAAAIPRLTNGDAALIRTAFDARAIRAIPADVEVASRACLAIGQAITGYVQAVQRISAGAPNPGAATETAMLEIQDETSLAVAAANLCLQRSFRIAADAIQGFSAERRASAVWPLRLMRDGAVLVINGSLSTVSMAGLRPPNRALVLSAMVEDPAGVAAAFPPAEREQLRARIVDAASRAAREDRPQVDRLAAAFADRECNLLCALAAAP
jgi:hypothetical protein